MQGEWWPRQIATARLDAGGILLWRSHFRSGTGHTLVASDRLSLPKRLFAMICILSLFKDL